MNININIKRYFKLIIIIIAIILSAGYNGVLAYNTVWDASEYDYGRFSPPVYVYDIGGHFKNINLAEYNGIFGQMRSDYGIIFAFVIADDYYNWAWDLAGWPREYGEDIISVSVTTAGGPGERDVAVYTHGKGQQVMSDRNVERMLDALIAELSREDWDGALRVFADMAAQMTEKYHAPPVSLPVMIAISAAIGLIIGLISMSAGVSAAKKKHKPVRMATHADYYVDDKSVSMKVKTDTFLRKHEQRIKIISSNNTGGGGRSGGSNFTGGSSSGRSGGGGSRKF
jgi:hypothetical protein